MFSVPSLPSQQLLVLCHEWVTLSLSLSRKLERRDQSFPKLPSTTKPLLPYLVSKASLYSDTSPFNAHSTSTPTFLEDNLFPKWQRKTQGHWARITLDSCPQGTKSSCTCTFLSFLASVSVEEVNFLISNYQRFISRYALSSRFSLYKNYV